MKLIVASITHEFWKLLGEFVNIRCRSDSCRSDSLLGSNIPISIILVTCRN